jgi:hypothetical protein
VPTRSAKAESSLTLKLRGNNLKFCRALVQGVHSARKECTRMRVTDRTLKIRRDRGEFHRKHARSAQFLRGE